MERRTHYIRRSTTSPTPRRHVFLDTEAEIAYRNGVQTQTWLLGAYCLVETQPTKKRPGEQWGEILDAGSLWADISTFAQRDGRTILWAHNLAYDLRIARALEILPDLGWSLRSIVLDGQSCWAKFTSGKATLLCTDLTSWLSMSLGAVASLVGLEQEARPDDPSDLRAQFRRCTQDVLILKTAVERILEWIDQCDLGAFQITGAAQSFSAFRHRFMSHRLLVHTDGPTLERERRAIWAGRTECWRHGTYTTEPTFEFDLSRAYATIARDETVPTQWLGTIPGLSAEQMEAWSDDRCFLSDCEVETDVPIVPTQADGRVVWPAGRFHTVLWDCELRAAVRAGASVHCGTSSVYLREPALRDWGTYVLDTLDSLGAGNEGLQRAILKHWSRALIGRFALRYREWTPFGTSDTSDLSLSKLTGSGVVKGARLMQAGFDMLELGAQVDSENAMPAITGYITSVCRMRLWELMNVAGLENVFYVDTDSIICSAAGADLLRSRIRSDGAFGLVEKRAIQRLELYGPRLLSVDNHARTAGIPKSARRTGPKDYDGEQWQGLGQAIMEGNTAKVLVFDRSFHIRSEDRRRRWVDNGRTEAYRLDYVESP